jgi:hypothetical protein
MTVDAADTITTLIVPRQRLARPRMIMRLKGHAGSNARAGRISR